MFLIYGQYFLPKRSKSFLWTSHVHGEVVLGSLLTDFGGYGVKGKSNGIGTATVLIFDEYFILLVLS